MTPSSILQEALDLQPYIVELRRRLHACPELSYQEVKTAELLASIFDEQGFCVKTGVAKTGVVADLGAGSRTVAVRADMDALPLVEDNQLPFKSTNYGVMHACGHDAHMACAIGAATILSRRSLAGRLRMIMQPAEETCDQEGRSGAQRMVEAGIMDKVDAIIGLHVSSSLPVGTVAIPAGPIFASADGFRITITSPTKRRSAQGESANTILVAAQVVQALQQVVSRKVSPLEPAVITVGAIHSMEDDPRIVGEGVTMEGTIRTLSESTRNDVWREMQCVQRIATIFGAEAELAWNLGYPATINDSAIAGIMRSAAVELLGADKVISIKPRMAAEDFSFFAQAVPAAFMLMGVEIGGDRRNHHSADFNIDESGLYLGAAILAETALRLMSS